MFIESDQIKDRTYDLCVIGAGPAGIIVSLEYAKLHPTAKILLLECGVPGTTVNPLDESIRNVNPVNHLPPYDCTNKGLGGSSISWGGRVVQYNEIDFMPHGAVQEHCTWSPSFYEAAKKYYPKAAAYFFCGDPLFEVSEMSEVAKDARIAEGFNDGAVTDRCLERWSLPTRFGREYQKALLESSSIEVLEGHYATEFPRLDEAGNAPVIRVKTLDESKEFEIAAQRFVISAGGQESTRLLLKSPRLFTRLEASPPALGKYYQGHISGKIAYVKFYGDPDRTEYGFIKDKDGVFCRRRFQFTPEALKEHGLLNIALWLDNPPYYDVSHGNGVMSFIYLMLIAPVLRTRLLPPAIWRSLTGGEIKDVGKHLWNVIKGLPQSFFIPVYIFTRRYFVRRSLPGVYLRSAENRYALHFHSEQIPHESNCMELGEDGNELIIDFHYMDEDVKSVIRAHKLLDQHLRKSNCGELEYICAEDELPEFIRAYSEDGVHQEGTTRIGNSPAEGVVDENLRVWGTTNVYVCSSSVFPTSSQANPTFFLGACAVRLANHMAQTVKQ
jgi:hypothetical protein